MMLPSLSRVILAGVLAQIGTSTPSHTWIADVKAHPASLAGQVLGIEGEVMDLRSTSPTARRGFYRLADASDPVGVLVRTDKLPMSGGSFRLRARIAPEQLVPGSLLLDEVERSSVNGASIVPLAAVIISGLGLLVIGALFVRAVAAERQYAVAAPLWLMPDAGPYGSALALPATEPPSLTYQPELEEADHQQKTILRRRRRGLFRALLGSLALTGSSAVWAVEARPEVGKVPAFIFIDSNDPSARSSRQAAEIPVADSTDQASEPRPIPIPPAPAPQEESPREAPKTTPKKEPPAGRPKPAVVATRPVARVADSVLAGRPRVPAVDTARTSAVLPPPPPPPPAAPPPAPPPAPVVQESTPDPEAERAQAEAAVGAGARRLVAAINARSSNDLAVLLPEAMAGDFGRRERFLKLIKDLGPRASLGTVEAGALANGRGEARFSVTVVWRGDFGLDRRKAGKFLGVVHRGTDGWQFEGARLLEAVP